ncbi:MAG: hypothetical protein WCA94_20870 [Candidatus Acidiferrum sp.]
MPSRALEFFNRRRVIERHLLVLLARLGIENLRDFLTWLFTL